MKTVEKTSACNYFEQNFPSCTSCNKQSTWVCKDKGESREYRIENVRDVKLCKVKIDDCVIMDATQNKSDFLMLCCEADKKYAIFVELKGTNIAHAHKQIQNAINLLKEEIDNQEYEICARVVVSRFSTPNLEKEGLPELKKKLSKNSNINYDIASNVLIEKKVSFSSKI